MQANFRVGQYVLERPLGEGGMAEVWLARNVHLGTPAAIKFLANAYAGVPEIEQRFLNEGRRQGALNHPNIIKVYGFEYVGDRSFLILQYIDGEALDRRLHRMKRLQPDEAVRIAMPILSALHHAHEHSIVHRDIKPSNILLDSSGIPYLGDFGIVLATNEKRITRAGMTMGTSLYMSPEQIREPALIDRRSDIYSFGCVLYEMFTGEPPFNPPSTGRGDTDFAIKMAHVQQPPPPLRQKNPLLSGALEAVIMRCLAKNQAERFQNCMQLRDALGAAMTARAAAAAPAAPGYAPPRPAGPVPPAMARPMSPAPVQPAPSPAFGTPAGGGAPFPQAYVPPSPAPTPVPMGAQFQMAQYAPPKKSSWPLVVGIAGVVLLITIATTARNWHWTTVTTTNPAVKTDQPQQPQQPQQQDEQQKQEEDREAVIAKGQAEAFMQNEARLSQQLGGEYHTLKFINKCGQSDLSVAATYMDLEGDWVTVGWWKVPPGAVVDSGAFSKNRVFYIYAHNAEDKVVWNGDGKPESHEEDVVDTEFARKVKPPEQLLGRNKHKVNEFKVMVSPNWGSWQESFTCGG